MQSKIQLPEELSQAAAGAASVYVPVPHQADPKRRRRSGRSRFPLQLVWPPDSLTRLVMEADGVTEFEMNGILQRVAAARAGP